jgi:hypothetical protein
MDAGRKLRIVFALVLFGAAAARGAEPDVPEEEVPVDIAALSIVERAEWVARAQRGRTSSREEAGIVDVFLATSGLGLTELKDRIDAGDDHRDLQQLVYHDLDDAALRRKLVGHVQREAAAVRKRHGRQGIKVLSDIDDTIYPNYGDRRAWSLDEAPYPGVVAFYAALTGPAPPGRSRLTFVSARPNERTGIPERYGRRKLRSMGLPPHSILGGDAWTLASILPGRIGERAIRKVGSAKLQNFQQWSELMGEYDFVISGDRTQADHEFAADALALENGRVLAGFIHDVGERPRRDAQHLFYNDTVLGHALDALAGGWIDRAGLARVREAVAVGHAAGVYPPELEPAVARDLKRAGALD